MAAQIQLFHERLLKSSLAVMAAAFSLRLAIKFNFSDYVTHSRATITIAVSWLCTLRKR